MIFQQKIIKFRDRELSNLHPGQEAYKPAIWFIYFIVCGTILMLEAMGMQYAWNNWLTIIMPKLPHFDYLEMLSFKIFFEVFR